MRALEIAVPDRADEARDVVVRRTAAHARGIEALQAAVSRGKGLRPVGEADPGLADVPENRCWTRRCRFHPGGDKDRPGHDDGRERASAGAGSAPALARSRPSSWPGRSLSPPGWSR